MTLDALPRSPGGDAESWSYTADGAIRHKDFVVQSDLPSYKAGDRIRMTLAGGVLAWHINGQRAAEVRGVPRGAHFGVGRLSSGPFEVRIELPAHLVPFAGEIGRDARARCAGEMRTSLEMRAELTGVATTTPSLPASMQSQQLPPYEQKQQGEAQQAAAAQALLEMVSGPSLQAAAAGLELVPSSSNETGYKCVTKHGGKIVKFIDPKDSI